MWAPLSQTMPSCRIFPPCCVTEFQAFYDRIMDLRQSPSPIRQLYVRAMFDYDSNKEADRPGEGISFHHGDILHVINGSDEEWWQACLVGSHAEDGPQGLIPSKRRSASVQTVNL